MAETQVKKGRGRPKKVKEQTHETKVVEATEEITMDDISNAMKEIVNEKMREAGIVQKEEQNTVKEPSYNIDEQYYKSFIMNADSNNIDEVTYEWQPIYNVLTRMYECSEENYLNVKYDGKTDSIYVNLDKNVYKSEETELSKIKMSLCSDAIKYNMKVSDDRIIIHIEKK